MSSLDDRLREKFRYVTREWEDMHDYQVTAKEFLRNNPFSALFVDTGLGKTIICLTLIQELLDEDRIDKKVLIIAPVRVACNTWPNEIGTWQHTAYLNHQVVRAEDDETEVISAGKKAAKRAKRFAANKGYYASLLELGDDIEGARKFLRWFESRARSKAMTAKKEELRQLRRRSTATVHLINREGVEWLVDQYTQWIERKVRGRIVKKRKIVDWPYDVVIIDEMTSFGDHTSERFKALAAVRTQGFIKRLHGLTATPVADGYFKLFSMTYLMDKGERFGRFSSKFESKYFDVNKYSRARKIKPGADIILNAKVSDICLEMKSKDYLDEHEPQFLKRIINLSDEQLALYKRMERDFMLTLPGEEGDDEIIEAPTAAALGSKLLQMCSGAVYTKDGRTIQLHHHKTEDLAQLYDELQGSPIMVAYWYRSSLAQLKKAFPFAREAGDGSIMDGPRSAWCQGKVPMLLVHPQGVAFGLNAQYGPGHDIYMYDHTWSWELFYQLYRRLLRQGQQDIVRIHMPETRHTGEKRIVGRLWEKQDAQEAFFAWLKARRKFMLRTLAA